ncbi:MAG: YraN family protein [Planctomycetota bacterium]|jgi:putative endonuclease
MPSARQRSGAAAEALVAEGLQDLGWSLVARNLRTPYAEVDLVMHDPAGTLVAVEVKARGPTAWLSEEDCLGPKQRARLFRAVRWIGQHHFDGPAARLNLALVELIGGRPVGWHMLEEIGLD